jgi:hypothetical protein
MNIYRTLFITLVLFFVSGCSDDDTTPSTISVTTISGVKITLSGDYKAICVDDGSGTGLIETINFNGALWTLTIDAWVGDLTCTGNPTLTDSVTASLVTSTNDISITGWVLSDGSIAPPPVASDGTGPLSATESVSPLSVTITSAGFGFQVGDTGTIFYVVDDTTNSTVLYSDDDAGTNSNATSDRAYVQ